MTRLGLWVSHLNFLGKTTLVFKARTTVICLHFWAVEVQKPVGTRWSSIFPYQYFCCITLNCKGIYLIFYDKKLFSLVSLLRVICISSVFCVLFKLWSSSSILNLQVIFTEENTSLLHLFTNACAIIGGYVSIHFIHMLLLFLNSISWI